MLRFLTFLVLISILSISCEKSPKYALEPAIRFEKISQVYQYNDQILSFEDNITATIYFEDGDGVLGLDQNDLFSEPYINLDNYEVQTFRKQGGIFVLDTFLNFNGDFPVLNPKNRKGPIDGTLSRSFGFPS